MRTQIGLTLVLLIAGCPTVDDTAVDVDVDTSFDLCAEMFSDVPADLDPFYTQHIDVHGIPVVASDVVHPAALVVTAYTVRHMLVHRPDAIGPLVDARIRVGVIGVDEVTTSLPEHSDLNTAFPQTDWDTRTRGVGATRARPLVSVGEENVLELSGDIYNGESILVHEFAHTLFDLGVAVSEPGLVGRLQDAYDAAIDAGLWQDTYAGSNVREYWAEGVQAHLNVQFTADPPDGIHNGVGTRQDLEQYDPALAALVAEVVSSEPWERSLCVP